MKEFQAFCDSLGSDFADSLRKEISELIAEHSSPLMTMAALDFLVTMRVLEQYHEWVHASGADDVQ